MAREPWTLNSPLLDRWVLRREIRGGGMGTVFEAWDEEYRRRVAIKVPAAKVNREIYEREAHIALGIEPHPNAALVIAVERVRARPIIVMDWYEDGDLTTWLRSPRLVADLPLVLRLAMQVCDGMMHLHHCGVAVHADLKPSNLLLSGREAVAIADFGLALAEASDRHCAGTPEYLPPEVTRGEGMSESSDIYTFGATLHEMLSGSPPFGARPSVSVEELARRHAVQPAPTLKAAPEGVAPLVAQCLRKDPDKRPGSFETVRERLADAYEELVSLPAPAPMRALDVGAWYWTLRGAGLCQLGRHEEEMAYHQRAIALDPTLAAAHSNLADSLRELGRHEEGLRSVERALELDPTLVSALDIKASLLDELGRSPEAESEYRRVIALDRAHVWAWYNLGLVLDRRKATDEALRCYEEAVRLRPELAQAWTNMGSIWEDDRHEFERAEACYRTALTHDPCLKEAIRNLGTLLQRQGRHAEAIDLFEEVDQECG